MVKEQFRETDVAKKMWVTYSSLGSTANWLARRLASVSCNVTNMEDA